MEGTNSSLAAGLKAAKNSSLEVPATAKVSVKKDSQFDPHIHINLPKLKPHNPNPSAVPTTDNEQKVQVGRAEIKENLTQTNMPQPRVEANAHRASQTATTAHNGTQNATHEPKTEAKLESASLVSLEKKNKRDKSHILTERDIVIAKRVSDITKLGKKNGKESGSASSLTQQGIALPPQPINSHLSQPSESLGVTDITKTLW